MQPIHRWKRAGTLVLTSIALSAIADAQCGDHPSGNAQLAIGGLGRPGSELRVRLEGEPGAGFLVAVNETLDPYLLYGQPFCLGPRPPILINYLTSDFFGLPASGVYEFDLSIPADLALVGRTFHFQSVILDSSAPSGVFAISNMVSVTIEAPQAFHDVYYEDFEAPDTWLVTHGTWQIGAPSSGPGSAPSGQSVAGTNLGGNYTAWANSRLVSPAIQLPTVAPGERLRLNFKSWYSFGSGDSCRVEYSTDFDQTTNPTWTEFGTSSTTILSGNSAGWTRTSVDLTELAGQRVFLAAHLTVDGNSSLGPGAYIDDFHIFRGVPSLASPEDWEGGLNPWYTISRGVWQVGEPQSGPGCVSGKVAATVLDGNYPIWQSSRLVCPPVAVPAGATRLRMNHWYSFGSADGGRVQVSTDDGTSWTDISQVFSGSSGGVCSEPPIFVSAYAGATVLIGFLHSADGNSSVGAGWIIDDIRFE